MLLMRAADTLIELGVLHDQKRIKADNNLHE